MTFLNKFINDEEGQDLVEYALLLGFIAIFCVVAITALGSKIGNMFNNTANKLT